MPYRSGGDTEGEEDAGQAPMEREVQKLPIQRRTSLKVSKDTENNRPQSQRDSEAGKEIQTRKAGKGQLLRGDRVSVRPGNLLLALPNLHQASGGPSS